MYITDLEEYVDFLTTHKISADAYMFMVLIALDELPTLYKFVELNHGLQEKEVNSLVERGYLINDNSVRNDYFADRFRIAPRFSKLLLEKSNSLVEELWEAYPVHIWVEGKRFNARNIEKSVLMEKYPASISHSRRKHKRVLAAIEFGKQNDLINCGLKKFIGTEQWKQLEDEMKETTDAKQFGAKEF